MREHVKLAACARSHQGRRPANQDAYLVLTGDDLGGRLDGLFVVADGMGGRASGGAASGLVVEVVRDELTAALEADAEPNLLELLSGSLQAANRTVFQRAGSDPQLEGMGATCVVAAVEDGCIFVAHMGDSRAYLLRDGCLHRLTEDHSLVAEKVRAGDMSEEQARKSRFRNVITKAVGLESEAEPELKSTDMLPGDVLLLCTDGLTGPVAEPEIAEIVKASRSARDASDSLISAALRNGGSDNVTVVVATDSRQQVADERSARVRRKGAGRWLLPAVLGLLLGVAIGLVSSRTVLFERLAHEQREVAPQAPERDLRHVTYETPISLLYRPLQGYALSLHRGRLYVVDIQGRLIKVDTSGRVIYEFPGRDALKPQSAGRSPTVAMDRQGNVYICEPANRRIAKYGADGVFLRGIGENELAEPQALVVDDTGDLYVIDDGRLKFMKAIPVRGEGAGFSEEQTP